MSLRTQQAKRGWLTPANLVVALVICAGVAAIALFANTSNDADSPRVDSSSAAGELVSQIHELQRAQTLDDFVAAAGNTPTARAWANRVWANREKLGVADLSWRFVSGGEPGVHRGGAVEARTHVSWRPGAGSGLTPRPTEDATVRIVFDKVDSGFAVRETHQLKGPLPLWMLGAITVERTDGARVVAVDGSDEPGTFSRSAARAVKAVSAILPSAASEPLVVIAPATQRQSASLLGRTATEIEQLAAVTTTVDGSASPGAAVAIIVNPKVFAAMDDRAAQVVMTHEATHLMTDASSKKAEAWVTEGFADYVALRRDSAALAVSAGQILTQVKESGAPKSLPSRADFDAGKHGLGATYEAAWMIFRMLAERFPEPTIVDFYRSVLEGTPVADAVGRSLGMSVDQLTQRWRDYLVKSVSTSS